MARACRCSSVECRSAVATDGVVLLITGCVWTHAHPFGRLRSPFDLCWRVTKTNLGRLGMRCTARGPGGALRKRLDGSLMTKQFEGGLKLRVERCMTSSETQVSTGADFHCAQERLGWLRATWSFPHCTLFACCWDAAM